MKVINSNFQRIHQQSRLESLPITIFVVSFNEKRVGYMSIIKQFSTWELDWYLYLDCLYLSEATRGQGIGLKLMATVKHFIKKKINNLQWQIPKDNFSAIYFYQKTGAIKKEKQRFFGEV